MERFPWGSTLNDHLLGGLTKVRCLQSAAHTTYNAINSAALAFRLGSSDEYSTSLWFSKSLSCGWKQKGTCISGTRGYSMVNIATYLEEFVHEDACSVDHGQIQRTPVLEEREIQELVVDCEIVI